MAGLPPEFLRGSNDFATVDGEELGAASVRQLLGVHRSDPDTPGELRWRQKFGLRLDRFRFLPNTPALAELVRTEVATGFSKWLPNLLFIGTTVDRKASSSDGRKNILVVGVNWRSRQGNLLSTVVEV